MTHTQIATQRLASQRIAGERCRTPEEVVRWMGAIQAQDYHQALWAVAARMQSATMADIETAIATGRILRTWPMRGTIHFVPAEDAGWMLKLCASRVVASHGHRMAQLGLTDDIMAQCEALFVAALTGGNRLTREQMLGMVAGAGIPMQGQRGYHVLWHLAHKGVICMGPMEGRQQTFVLLSEWVAQPRELAREEALAELVWRYFASHGPATEADFARWSGLTLTDTRAGLAQLQQRLTMTEYDGVAYWIARTAGTAPDATSGVTDAHLLAAFDETVIGYQDRSAFVPDEHAAKIVPGNNGVFQPVMVLGAQVVGTWKRELKRKAVRITLHPFSPLEDAEARFATPAQAYSHFAGMPLAD